MRKGALQLDVCDVVQHCCHCRNRQNKTGRAFILNSPKEPDRIETLGAEPEPTTVQSGQGRPHDIYRCPDCRTAA